MSSDTCTIHILYHLKATVFSTTVLCKEQHIRSSATTHCGSRKHVQENPEGLVRHAPFRIVSASTTVELHFYNSQLSTRLSALILSRQGSNLRLLAASNGEHCMLWAEGPGCEPFLEPHPGVVLSSYSGRSSGRGHCADSVGRR